jgi:hypothetical protein
MRRSNMKKWLCLTVIGLGLFIVGASPGRSQAQETRGYTFLQGSFGPQVCVGRWVPSSDVAVPGTCEGQLMGVSQFTAVSSERSADRLDQMLVSLSSIDQKLAVSNDQLERLIDATVNTQKSISEQAKSVSSMLHEMISRRFDELPAEMMASEEFKKEISKLKEEILGDVERLYPQPPAPPSK